jgi:hypothetical protein
MNDGFEITTESQQQRHWHTKTREWKLLVIWKDGLTSSWVPLMDLKESFPVQVAAHAVVHKIMEEPDFAWWAATKHMGT